MLWVIPKWCLESIVASDPNQRKVVMAGTATVRDAEMNEDSLHIQITSIFTKEE